MDYSRFETNLSMTVYQILISYVSGNLPDLVIFSKPINIRLNFTFDGFRQKIINFIL